MKIICNLHSKRYKTKPDNEEVKNNIRKSLGKSSVTIEPEELIEAIEHGQTFTPSYMTGTKAESWQSQQIIVADIDNDKTDKTVIDHPLTPDKALMLLSFYDIEPYCMYYSFSNTPNHPKYRIVLILEEPLTDPAEALDLNGRFTAIFNRYTAPEKCADTSIVDNARLIFGSTPGSVFHHSKTITSIDLLRALPCNAVERATSATNDSNKENTHRSTTTSYSGDFDLLPLLDYIDPGTLNYEEWLNVGKALKYEGYSATDWDLWSRRDNGLTSDGKHPRYQSGLCFKKWDTFNGANNGRNITGATITAMAKQGGYIPPKDRPKVTSVSDLHEPTFEEDPNDPGAIDPLTGRTENAGATTITTQEPTPEPVDAVEEFFEEIQTERFKPIPTGIKQLDEALDGGLTRKTLITLASAPGMGKTAISQYIFENMAKKGHGVIYVNLEMDRSQLLSRSISRIAFEQCKRERVKTSRDNWEDFAKDYEAKCNSVSQNEILRGYKWTDSQRHRIRQAVDEYKQTIAPRFHYVTTNPDNSGHITNQLHDIMARLEAITEGMLQAGQDAPLICVDYLQFVDCDITADGELIINTTERKPDTAEAIKRTLQAFKLFAMKYNTVVWLIMANNRTSNQEGRATMDSGRDTSNIEYSGDVMLSLVYTAIESKWKVPKGKDKDGNTKYSPCDLEFIHDRVDYCRETLEADDPLISKLQSLKVVKSRSMRCRGVAKFIYNGKFSTFEPDEGITNPYDKRKEDEEAKQAEAMTKDERTMIKLESLEKAFDNTEVNGVSSVKELRRMIDEVGSIKEVETLVRMFPDRYKITGDSVKRI